MAAFQARIAIRSLAATAALLAAGCSKVGAADTSFMGACLKDSDAPHCSCIQRALKSSVPEADYVKYAGQVKPGQIGQSFGDIEFGSSIDGSTGLQAVAGTRYHILREEMIGSCTQYSNAPTAVPLLQKATDVWDKDGRFVANDPHGMFYGIDRKGKRAYEAWDEWQTRRK